MSSSPSSSHPSERRRRCPGSASWASGLRARAVLMVTGPDGEKVLGPRFVRLLEEVRDRGSIRRAALALGLGYRHALDWIRRAEATLGRPLVVRHAGGAAGGGAGLTDDGIALVRNYRRVSAQLARIAAHAEAAILGAQP